MGYAQPVITQQMVLSELVKAWINRDIAIDLSYGYYRNELTYKDIEYLKENFDVKLAMLGCSLKFEIRELDNKIEIVENNLNVKTDII
ncbi:BDR-repeat family protein (plasmid) [Borrelia hermsii YBT]|uniref:BDR-repeat family protein n=1 Tax=Borrelia hermsii YBT TaxID=1313295 RepID=W5T1P2_BORHE